jgi:hypothetical protein
MKKIIGVLSLAVMMLTLSSCEVETSQNGDLDGFWHLEQVDTLATGGTCNFADKRVFWVFSSIAAAPQYITPADFSWSSTSHLRVWKMPSSKVEIDGKEYHTDCRNVEPPNAGSRHRYRLRTP